MNMVGVSGIECSQSCPAFAMCSYISVNGLICVPTLGNQYRGFFCHPRAWLPREGSLIPGFFASSPTLLTGFCGLRQTTQTRENDNPRIHLMAPSARQRVTSSGV